RNDVPVARHSFCRVGEALVLDEIDLPDPRYVIEQDVLGHLVYISHRTETGELLEVADQVRLVRRYAFDFCTGASKFAALNGEDLRRADKRARPAARAQARDPASAAQLRELPTRRARSPIGSPRYRRWDRRPPRVREPAPRTPQAQGRVSPGEGLP